ncbi:hypothetical protein [Streptomyces sp. NPDC048644]|uniref:scabin-related ADP-ribosyltransferase n=1 Tax=Streptomyces sp. NPDC048644 TaxID=3365582 RepID=UPI00371E93C7
MWREDHEPLYRNDSRHPQEIFDQGLHPRDSSNADLYGHVEGNQASAFVGTTKDAAGLDHGPRSRAEQLGGRSAHHRGGQGVEGGLHAVVRLVAGQCRVASSFARCPGRAALPRAACGRSWSARDGSAGRGSVSARVLSSVAGGGCG